MAESQSLAQDPDPEADLRALNIHVPHPARVYDYWLGGKDNISQAVPRCPHSGRTSIIQARHAHFSNVDAIAVR
jgi:hypothetical protein